MPWSRRIARRLLADQRGQDTVEYIGVLAVVAALIGVVLLVIGPLGPMIEHGAECLVAKVFQLDTCRAGPAYPVSASTKTVGYDGRVAIVDGGHSYTITLTKLSNGTSKITAIDNGKIGVSAQVGADAELGPLGSAGADASIGGGIYGGTRTRGPSRAGRPGRTPSTSSPGAVRSASPPMTRSRGAWGRCQESARWPPDCSTRSPAPRARRTRDPCRTRT